MNEKLIWDKLIGAGLTPAGAAGLMGNFRAESNLEPTNLQNTYERKLGYTDATYTASVDAGTYANFVTDAAGYGLAQWTYSGRKKALLAYAKSQGKSVGDLGMQVDFTLKELRESYPAVWNVLTTTSSVRSASDVVLLQYERPADTSERVRNLRAGFGEKYLAEYSDTLTEPETPPCPAAEMLHGILTIGSKTYDVALTEIRDKQ